MAEKFKYLRFFVGCTRDGVAGGGHRRLRANAGVLPKNNTYDIKWRF
jgi:hypothetical protein